MGRTLSTGGQALLAGLLVLLAGCVSGWGPGTGPFDGHHHDGPHMHDWDTGDDHEDSEGVGNYTGNETVTLEVTGGQPSEFRFDPDTYEVPAGETVAVVFTNEGDADHEFAIQAVDFHVHAEPGETVRASFVAPDEPGEYEVGCYLPGHYEQGMKGTLVVT